eukprot:1160102-Pelagomonas_calceolata.AAC.4
MALLGADLKSRFSKNLKKYTEVHALLQATLSHIGEAGAVKQSTAAHAESWSKNNLVQRKAF